MQRGSETFRVLSECPIVDTFRAQTAFSRRIRLLSKRMPILFLLFVLVPIIEIALFIQVGGFLGLVPTLIIVVATAALGTWLLRQQGLSTMERARSRLDAGELPAAQLIEGVILMVGGALLLTPGFMTDAVGFACLLPPSRRWLASYLGNRFQMVALNGVAGEGGGFPGGSRSGTTQSRGAPGAKGEGDVIEGEWQQVDREP
jgi:UPF0716 protein FxsA